MPNIQEAVIGTDKASAGPPQIIRAHFQPSERATSCWLRQEIRKVLLLFPFISTTGGRGSKAAVLSFLTIRARCRVGDGLRHCGGLSRELLPQPKPRDSRFPLSAVRRRSFVAGSFPRLAWQRFRELVGSTGEESSLRAVPTRPIRKQRSSRRLVSVRKGKTWIPSRSTQRK